MTTGIIRVSSFVWLVMVKLSLFTVLNKIDSHSKADQPQTAFTNMLFFLTVTR